MLFVFASTKNSSELTLINTFKFKLNFNESIDLLKMNVHRVIKFQAKAIVTLSLSLNAVVGHYHMEIQNVHFTNTFPNSLES